jgi:hypothetical protein
MASSTLSAPFKTHISKADAEDDTRRGVAVAYLQKHKGLAVASVWSDRKEIGYIIVRGQHGDTESRVLRGKG